MVQAREAISAPHGPWLLRRSLRSCLRYGPDCTGYWKSRWSVQRRILRNSPWPDELCSAAFGFSGSYFCVLQPVGQHPGCRPAASPWHLCIIFPEDASPGSVRRRPLLKVAFRWNGCVQCCRRFLHSGLRCGLHYWKHIRIRQSVQTAWPSGYRWKTAS